MCNHVKTNPKMVNEMGPASGDCTSMSQPVKLDIAGVGWLCWYKSLKWMVKPSRMTHENTS